MRRISLLKPLSILLLLATVLSFSGVFATWMYAGIPLSTKDSPFVFEINEFEWKVYDLYITDIQKVSGPDSISYEKKHPTSISTAATISSNTTVTYRVTIFNNTDITYWYKGLRVNASYGANSLVGSANAISVTTKDNAADTYASFSVEDWIPPHTERDIYITYTYGAGARGELENLIELEFGKNMDAVHDQFLTVLNDKVSQYGYNYLAEMFDQKYSESGKTVIGNVGEDEEIFNNIFGSELSVNVGGQIVPVTVMICRENVDGKSGTGDAYSPSGPTGCEYSVYITLDPLSSPTGEAVVYAISYSCDSNGVWRQLGQLYEGVADISDYDGYSGDFIGAFDVRTWEATPAYYEVTDDIVYLAGMPLGQGDQYDQYKTIKQLMSASDQDIFNTIDNTRIFKKVYDILVANPSDKPGIEDLRRAFDNAAPYYTNFNNGQEFKVNRNCTRAEIIPFIIAIQHALDYYNDVN